MRKVLILNTFGLFPSIPPYSTSFVTSLLRKNNVSVEQIDLSLEIWDHMLSKQYLETLTLKKENLKDSSFALCPEISEKTFSVIKENVLDNIDKAKAILKDEKSLTDVDKMLWAVNIIFQAQQVIYYNYGTFIGDKPKYWPKMGFDVHSISTIYELSEDRMHNPFITIYEKLIIPKIMEINPSIIGIDMMWEWDIIPALTLNKLIKKSMPNVHINFIGHGYDEFCFARLKDRLENESKLFFSFDSVFLVRNDDALVKLVTLDSFNNNKLKDIPSLAYLCDNIGIANSPFIEGTIDFSIEPDYSDLKLSKYLTPNIMFAEKMSSGCFWSKCNYCCINRFKKFRQETNIDNLIERIKNYKTKYNCKHLLLADESVSPEQVTNLVEQIIKNKIDLTWSVRTRVNENYNAELLQKMYSAGCREVWVGVESISPDILKFINKTEKPETYKDTFLSLMKNCNSIGIGLHICLMFNIPSQTQEHYEKLIQFFKENKKYLSNTPFFATFNVFSLIKDTDMYKNPSQFHITEIVENKDNFGMTSIPYRTEFFFDPNSKDINKNLDVVANRLISIFVNRESLKLLWMFSSINLELFLKEKHYKINPFQSSEKLSEKILMKLYFKVQNNPTIMKWINKYMASKY